MPVQAEAWRLNADQLLHSSRLASSQPVRKRGSFGLGEVRAPCFVGQAIFLGLLALIVAEDGTLENGRVARKIHDTRISEIIPRRFCPGGWTIHAGTGGRMAPESVVGCVRNGWSDGPGIAGRIASEYAIMRRLIWDSAKSASG